MNDRSETDRRHTLKLIVATCFGLGYSPIFPGTAGALIGVAIFLPAALWTPWSVQIVSVTVGFVISTWLTIVLAPWAEEHFEEKDSGKFVTDEVAGFLLTVLLFWPFYSGQVELWRTLLWMFLFTRVIDIIKIPPAKQLEKLPAGWGVVMDDLLGSVYAAILLHVLVLVYPAMFGIAT